MDGYHKVYRDGSRDPDQPRYGGGGPFSPFLAVTKPHSPAQMGSILKMRRGIEPDRSPIDGVFP
ncbi:hypothetical protein [Methanoculleus thermophilus]|uniref:hypothetical protein n=1 Tax=Methanoculleus thermophilus TaxID=2200 RepID=UPI000ACFFC9A|nr:hypothetical protein [Methanoculleus thermophilus]